VRGLDPEGVSVVLAARTSEEMEAIGQGLAAVLRRGDMVCLYGVLGSGKTTFVRGVHRGLGCGGRVRSPSFATLLVYAGTPPLYHFDLYRYEAAGPGFLDEFAEWFPGDGVGIVEWADRLGGWTPDPRLDVRIEEVASGDRTVTVAGVGADWSDRLTGIRGGARWPPAS
jgi:tRNA threonylcarbamoyladenosine biosynthesis protein TsaE